MEKNKDDIRKEALAKIKDSHRVGLGITMGGGKTLIGLSDMARIFEPGDKFLVVAPKKSIHSTWLEESDKFKLSFLKDAMVFTTYLSLNKQTQKFKKIYLDEAHSLKFGHQPFLDKYRGPILGLTGTPPTLDYTEKGRMIKQYCPIVYSYITDDAVDDKILNDYKIYIHYLDLDTAKTVETKMKNGSVFYTSEVENYNYWTNRLNRAMGKELEICRLMRMKTLQKFKSKEVYVKKLVKSIDNKCLIFANEKLQADRVAKYSYHSGNSNSKANLELFKEGKIDTMSCVLQLSEGANIPNLRESIIMHGYGNQVKFKQRFGRCLRLHVDDSAIIHLLCYRNTVDSEWVDSALSSFNPDKIIKLDPNIKKYGRD